MMPSGEKDTTAAFSSNLASALMALGTQSCLAWLLGPAGRGEYATCIVFSGVLSITFSLGVEMSLVYYVGSRRLRLSDALGACLVWGLLGSLAGIAAGYALTTLSWPFFQKAPLSAFRLSLLLVPLNLAALAFTRALIGLGRLVAFSTMMALRAAITLVFTLCFLLLLELDVHGALWAVILAHLSQIILILIFLRRKSDLKFVLPSADALRKTLGYGARFYLGKLGRQLNFRMGTLLLAFFATKSQVGLFAAAIAIITRVWMIPEALNVVLLPRTSGEEQGRPRLVARCSRISVYLSSALILLLLIFAKPLVSLVLSPKFLPVVPLMWIMALGVLVRTYPKVLASYFNGVGRPGRNSLAILAGLAMNLCLLPILFPWLGLPGAALTLLIAYWVETALAAHWFIAFSGLPSQTLWRPARSDWVDIRGFFSRLTGSIPGRGDS